MTDNASADTEEMLLSPQRLRRPFVITALVGTVVFAAWQVLELFGYAQFVPGRLQFVAPLWMRLGYAALGLLLIPLVLWVLGSRYRLTEEGITRYSWPSSPLFFSWSDIRSVMTVPNDGYPHTFLISRDGSGRRGMMSYGYASGSRSQVIDCSDAYLLLRLLDRRLSDTFDLATSTLVALVDKGDEEAARSSDAADRNLASACKALSRGHLTTARRRFRRYARRMGRVPEELAELEYVLGSRLWLLRFEWMLRREKENETVAYFMAEQYFRAAFAPNPLEAPPDPGVSVRRLSEARRGFSELLSSSRYGEQARKRLEEIRQLDDPRLGRDNL